MQELIETIVQVLVIALAVSTISMTITRAFIFEGMREWIESKNEWLGKLFSCPYCTSHWIALVFVAIYRPTLVHFSLPVDLIVSWAAIVALASFSSGIIFRAFNSNSEE